MDENDLLNKQKINNNRSQKLKINYDLSNTYNGSSNLMNPSDINSRQRSNELTTGTNNSNKNNFSQEENENIINSNTKINDTEESIDETEKEAIELLKTQHEQIKKYKKELLSKDKIINNLNQQIASLNLKLKDNNDNYISNNNSLVINNNNLKQQINLLTEENKEIQFELQNKEKLIFELQKAVESLTKKFNEINNDLNSVVQSNNSEKMGQLINTAKQCSKEKKISDSKISLYEKEINKLNKALKKEMQLRQKYEMIYNDKIKDEKIWLGQVNKDINLICQWIENYLGVYFDKSIKIPSIPCFTPPLSQENLNLFNKFNFSKLRQEIFDVREKILDKQIDYENEIEKYKKEVIDLIDNINKLNKDINVLNNEVLSLKEEINKKNIDFDMMKNQVIKF